MALETTSWDIQEHISTPERQLGYLEAAFEDGDPTVIAAAIGDIARARGMTAVAHEAGLTREGLYKALSATGDPKLSTVISVLKVLGIQITASPVTPPELQDASR